MPIYEYQCKSCGAVSEIFSNVAAHSDSLTCKKCGSPELDKMLSAASIPTFPQRQAGKPAAVGMNSAAARRAGKAAVRDSNKTSCVTDFLNPLL
jgi:putative FmdB family regulatory protein